MRYLGVLLILVFVGCASVSMTDYVKSEHPYVRKIYGTFEKVTSCVLLVLHHKGWEVSREVDPEVFERDERYENNGYQNVLIMAGRKKHLNVFVHCFENICDVEIRFGPKARNDRLAESIFNALEQEIKE
ncbi:MAG: hypothetical protein HQL14_04450 [Candidatus Omnitrophica bacterium]|nr:hypothetical protein [Candidatus Omnitrophota bacterium]